jgi:SAM-dependent methyltransferase
LPIASQSIDVVALPHVLEFSDNPHQILREVDRILRPEGHVLISGFNPFSLWGLRRIFSRGGAEYPWQGHYLAVGRLRDWLKLLGLETQGGAFGCYVPPVLSEQWLQRWDFMARAGDRWWPYTGAVYVVSAVKRVRGMRLIRPAWNKRSARRALQAVVRRDQSGAKPDTL